MGQKVHPIGFRLGSYKGWRSIWYADKNDMPSFIEEDYRIRQFLKKKLQSAAISDIVIERAGKGNSVNAVRVRVTIYSARPGLIYGRKSTELEKTQEELRAMFPKREILLEVREVKNPETNAQLIAENIALQLERRVSFRRAMKKAVQTAMDFGALGVRVRCSGRLGGADIARAEQYREGKVPLHTLRANIDYGTYEAQTVAGKVGVKVWICQKEEAQPSA